ncbi:MAG: molybdenum cofactor biosynthesis protein MoaE [Opitutales bacterium]
MSSSDFTSFSFPLVDAANAERLQPQFYRELQSSATGAVVTFGGFVRDHHQGRHVVKLHYTAFEPLAQKEGVRLQLEALKRYSVHAVRAYHVLGKLFPGQPAVWVGVAASHRAEAFEACSWLLEAIKARVPIWKEEFFADGSVEWVDPTTSS